MTRSRHMAGLLVLALVVLGGCPDDGSFVEVCDTADLRCDDGSACTQDRCEPGVGCVHERISCSDADICTDDSCEPETGCVHRAISCDDGNQCTVDTCDSLLGCRNEDISASCDDGDACTMDRCDPDEGCVNAPLSCEDGNDCTTDTCDPLTGCASEPVPDGTFCASGPGQCLGGVCTPVDCIEDDDCNDNDACTQDRCNPTSRECVHEDISASCDDGDACTEDRCAPETGCVNEDISASCDDGEECTLDMCVPEIGCDNDPVADGTSCDGGAGECSGGICVPLASVQYMQDFELLDPTDPDALADDGWLVFGNVFDGSEAFLYAYGPFPAPNNGAAFCAIVTGQGGPEQGEQQLSVYSDYNNADHANGYRIESTVYRERAITAADVGRTISFRFGAKRGNINDPDDPLCPCDSTATAFVKTLDPTAGFATTNLVSEETTALAESWARFELSLAIDAGLVGQLLQVGFTSTATLFQPSANFYDNLEVSIGPSPP